MISKQKDRPNKQYLLLISRIFVKLQEVYSTFSLNPSRYAKKDTKDRRIKETIKSSI